MISIIGYSLAKFLTYHDSIENVHVRKNTIHNYMTTTKEIRVYIVIL